MEDKTSKGKEIRLKEIKVEKKVSIRDREDDETINRYKENLESLPPIIVFKQEDGYLLADGFHRVAAAERLGWEYINAEVREGRYEDAIEFAAKANLKHGKPLTAIEYEKALKLLKSMHEDWTQEKLASVLDRSREWVSSVIAADRVEKMLPGNNLDTRTKAEISRAPKELWEDIGRMAQEQEWTRDETQEKVKAIKAEPGRAKEILQSQDISIPEAPADKLIPLTKEIKKVCEEMDKLFEIENKFNGKLDHRVYDWGSGALAVHVLHGLYVLAEKTINLTEKTRQVAERTKKMIEFLEEKGKGQSTTPPLQKGSPSEEVKIKGKKEFRTGLEIKEEREKNEG